METIYDWLLHNTENAGNFYTILNTRRDGSDSLEVMARSPDFTIVNLFIHDTKNTDSAAGQSAESSDQTPGNSYVFSDEQQVIAYLAEGKTPESQPTDDDTGIRVLVAEPKGEAGDITFPPT